MKPCALPIKMGVMQTCASNRNPWSVMNHILEPFLGRKEVHVRQWPCMNVVSTSLANFKQKFTEIN